MIPRHPQEIPDDLSGMFVSLGRMRRSLWVMIGLWGCLVASAAFAAETGQMRFSLQLVEEHVGVGEPQQFTLQLENAGAEPVWVNKRFYISAKEMPLADREVTLEVTDANGTVHDNSFTYETGLPKSDDFHFLEPGEVAQRSNPADLRRYFSLEEPGTYTVTAVYENVFGDEIGLDTFRGPVRAEPVTLTIVDADP